MATDMDPISKALERAQRDGRSVRNWVAPSASASARDTTRPAAPSVSARLVDLDADLLAGRNLLSGPDHEDPVIADKYRLLRTQLLTRMQAHGWSKIGVTSSGPKAGKTLTSINLALSIARDGSQHVVLIDADLRKSSMAEDLGLNGEVGLIDYLSSDLALEEVAVTPRDIPNLMIIPGRRIDPTTSTPEVLRTAKMHNLVRGFGAETIVVVDLPPVVVGDDVITVAAHLDGMLLVIEEGGTDVEELQHAAKLLEDFNLLGSVLNKSMEKNREVEGYYQQTAPKHRRLSKPRQA
jgi:protein-tyrosine kinase